MGFVGMEEDECRANIGSDAGTQLPTKRLGIVFARQAVIQASIGHEFIDKSLSILACSYKSNKIWMPHPAENLHLLIELRL
uniref:Uncharacterized protein n=1 Tax=Arundo donax TaxID=35708 RepID=A0A0A9PM30_ARUDO